MKSTPRRRTELAALITAAVLAAPLTAAGPAHAVTGGKEPNNLRAYTARLDIGGGDRACTGALVAPQWLLTAKSCFAERPAASIDVPEGAPKSPTKAVIGRTDLTSKAGSEREVVQLVPRSDRDVVLAKLSAPVTNVAPAVLASAPAEAGQSLTTTGYGRSRTDWSPLDVHHGTFTAAAADGVDVELTGAEGDAICAGDAGAPLAVGSEDRPQIAAIASRSDQAGCFGIDPAQKSSKAIASRTDDLAAWVGEQTGQAGFVDFNGDGVEDIAIGDPYNTVSGIKQAGSVSVVYGGGKGSAQIDQSLSFVPGGAEANDRFGHALATVDYDKDGYTDLVVGIPYEDLKGQADSGMVSVVYGSPTGLGKGRASTNFEQGEGTGALKSSAAEAGDMLGYSVTAGITRTGNPFIFAGTPGESIGSAKDAGSSVYITGGTSFGITQGNGGAAGAIEAGDQHGWSVASDANYIAIGAPGESIGTKANAGNVSVLRHPAKPGTKPTYTASINQDESYVSGGAEAGDKFGYSLSMTAYRGDGEKTATSSALAVGSPGEGIVPPGGGAEKKEAGHTHILSLAADGSGSQLASVSQMNTVNQNEADTAGGSETYDHFGERVAIANRAPGKIPGRFDLVLAIGSPGEDLEGISNTGAVQTYSAIGKPGDGDRWIEIGSNGIPGPKKTNQYLGTTLTATPTNLYIGTPFGPAAKGAVYSLPWTTLTGGPKEPTTMFQPGKDGIPNEGSRFGTSVQ